jgi:outer membrane protein
VLAEKLKSKQNIIYLIMKKILMLVTVFCFLAFQVINAQTDKGRIIVGISSTASLSGKGSDIMGLGFSSTKYVSPSGTSSAADKSSFLNLIPKVGYFIIDNLAAGLDLTISTYATKYSDKTKSTGTLLCVGPFARYYVPLNLDKFRPFAELNAGIGGTKSKYTSSSTTLSSEHKSGVFLIGFWAGMAMPLGDRVTFDAMLGYNHVTYSTKATSETGGSGKTKEKTGTFGVKMGFVVFFDMK